MVHQLGIGFRQTTTDAGERRHASLQMEPKNVTVERLGGQIDLTPNTQMQGLDLIRITVEGRDPNSACIWLGASQQTAVDLANAILAVADGSAKVVRAQL